MFYLLFQCGVALDGHLLLGKVQYTLGDFEGALKHFIEADLQGLTEKTLAPRSVRIISESFAIKGWSLFTIRCLPFRWVNSRVYHRYDFIYRIVFGENSAAGGIEIRTHRMAGTNKTLL